MGQFLLFVLLDLLVDELVCSESVLVVEKEEILLEFCVGDEVPLLALLYLLKDRAQHVVPPLESALPDVSFLGAQGNQFLISLPRPQQRSGRKVLLQVLPYSGELIDDQFASLEKQFFNFNGQNVLVHIVEQLDLVSLEEVYFFNGLYLVQNLSVLGFCFELPLLR